MLLHRWRIGGRVGSLLGLLLALLLNGWQVNDLFDAIVMSVLLVVGGEVGDMCHNWLVKTRFT